MFEEPSPEHVTPNPGGLNDPLGESVVDPQNPWLRVFEPADTRIVIGRGQDVAREVHCDAARTKGVPIHRRISGGGAVILAPGMVVVAVRLKVSKLGSDCYFGQINDALMPAVEKLCGVKPGCRGFGDLAFLQSDGRHLKICGASLRQNSKLAMYLGVLMVNDAVPLMQEFLAAPSREPAYRSGRPHAEFCANLSRFDVTTRAAVAEVERQCTEHLRAHALM
jgi:lipoate-protein ligase A